MLTGITPSQHVCFHPGGHLGWNQTYCEGVMLVSINLGLSVGVPASLTDLDQCLFHSLSEAVANGQPTQPEDRGLNIGGQGTLFSQLACSAVCHCCSLDDVVRDAGHILACAGQRKLAKNDE